ncbi:MAG: hypothetical protein A2W28_03110 [Gammaproteobacteria bacterium RBG_16_51_14]|nr:MAG: hypothetical protein A2W28_03110 [Gammaproteobacteria bacterium RBG_16_51_14]
MDVIHANWAICGVVAGLAGKALGISVVTTLRGEDMTRAACKLLDKLLLKLCICLSDGMVGVSQTIVDFLRQRTVPGKTHVCLIENGVDDALLSIQREYNDIKILRLITIGSLIPRKGMDVILKALNAYTGQIPLTLTIVGEGVEEIALRRLAQENDLAERVHFIGAVKPDHIPRLLQQHDVLILASYSEGRPNVILEAMAAEMPVIGSDIPGVDELVRDGETGFLFKAGDTSELAASIDSLLQTQASLRRMGRNARQDILQRGLVWQTTADKYSTLYRTVMRANR